MKNTISEIVATGLCSSCNLLNQCAYRTEFKGAIFQCEEFQDTTPVLEFVIDEAEHNYPIMYSSLKGLCMNCDLARTCAQPKPETGVWFCNEYK